MLRVPLTFELAASVLAADITHDGTSWKSSPCGSGSNVRPHSWDSSPCGSGSTVCPHSWESSLCGSGSTVRPHSWESSPCGSDSTVRPHSWSTGTQTEPSSQCGSTLKYCSRRRTTRVKNFVEITLRMTCNLQNLRKFRPAKFKCYTRSMCIQSRSVYLRSLLFAGTNFSELGMQLIWRVLILAF